MQCFTVYFLRCSTCFRQFFHPSSGAQNCTYSVRYLSDWYLMYVQFWAPDDGRKNRLKHVEHLTEINKLWHVASCWLYSANMIHVCSWCRLHSDAINQNFFIHQLLWLILIWSSNVVNPYCVWLLQSYRPCTFKLFWMCTCMTQSV